VDAGCRIERGTGTKLRADVSACGSKSESTTQRVLETLAESSVGGNWILNGRGNRYGRLVRNEEDRELRRMRVVVGAALSRPVTARRYQSKHGCLLPTW
jgi:hypothetical protein